MKICRNISQAFKIRITNLNSIFFNLNREKISKYKVIIKYLYIMIIKLNEKVGNYVHGYKIFSNTCKK